MGDLVMPAGLQVWDANGNIILDVTYRVLRIIDSVRLSSGSSGNRFDDRLTQGGWVSFQPDVSLGDGYMSGGVIAPRFSISGNTLAWSYAAKNSGTYDIYQDGTLFYGAS
ncbi:hypothetical protein ACFSHT_10460 [Paraburkholderia silviterrae]|uniref:Uncharacterized protein n=1 Tax=Paraburkholderia silviterrae TaxID=2528715 RepID=A0A4R5ME42_9BURK|nr:hypothetical protein [Paraburkholderia silviterrae]TDG25372.1 hypothetical protein EYW47_05940 [Paraburkholderia silviterrae]